MESEKVKEIKKGLECCTNPVYCEKECPYHIYERHLECINELAKDSLTLINELESENKKLLEENESLNGSWKNAIKRIAELLDSVETVQNNRCTTKCELTEKQLKQFAERLKEKFYYEGRICRYIIDSDVFDETLKEFINEE